MVKMCTCIIGSIEGLSGRALTVVAIYGVFVTKSQSQSKEHTWHDKCSPVKAEVVHHGRVG